jgi:26S proteasome regulatory subunit N10
VEAKTKLDDIPEGEEKQPLLVEDGEPSNGKDEDEEKPEDKDNDKMDTA